MPQKGGALFDFNSNDIRVIDIDGIAWFVLKDVCDLLDVGNVTDATRNLDQIEVQTYRIPGTRGRPNKLISESGLYKVVMRSDKPEARESQDWVARVVLPVIRKDGGYVRGEEKVETEEDIMEMSLRTMDMLRKKLAEKSQQLDVVSDT